jgi:methyl-accepting chemotaxis protein
MNNLKISTRLLALIGLMSLLLAGVGGFGLNGARESNLALNSVYENNVVPLRQLAGIRYLLTRNRVVLMDAMLVPEPENIRRRTDEMDKNTAQIGELWKAYSATKLVEEEAATAKEFEVAYPRYQQEGLQPGAQAMRAGKFDDAMRIYREKVSPLSPAAIDLVGKLLAIQVKVAEATYSAEVARYKVMLTASIISIVVGVLLAIGSGMLLLKSISRSLKEAMTLSDAVAQGDLTHQADIRGNDEISQVLKTLSGMQQRLGQIVSRVRQGSDAVSTASIEIAQGNHDLSSRTENQASALEETAASMEQLSSTVQHNASNAKTADQLAKAAAKVAKDGGVVVREVVSTMEAISESSHKISEIISVIDGIAFQTNILALNAAVEAARAGEQGRGFAVVASEVRSLAGRSAEAAKQIKTLISESADRVTHGGTLVRKAGATMDEVVQSIQRVTDIMGEISAASTEQSQGVSQVGEAVTQIDQVTQQNAALVEQMAAAASSLRSQADDLVQTVAFFKVSARDAQGEPLMLAAR